LTSLRLVNPSKDYEASYRSLLEEFRARGERLIPFPLSFPHENFSELIARLEENSNGLGITRHVIHDNVSVKVRQIGYFAGDEESFAKLFKAYQQLNAQLLEDFQSQSREGQK
jgi:hypothetical protein